MCAIVPAIATGLGLFQGLAMRNAAKRQAEQTPQTEYANIRSQEDAKNLTHLPTNLTSAEYEAMFHMRSARR